MAPPSPFLKNISSLVFEHFLAFWHNSIFWLTLFFSIQVSSFFKEPWSFSVENGFLETVIWVPGVLSATEMSLLQALSVGKVRRYYFFFLLNQELKLSNHRFLSVPDFIFLSSSTTRTVVLNDINKLIPSLYSMIVTQIFRIITPISFPTKCLL